MKSFYNIVDSIEKAIKAEAFNNAVTFGDIADIDLKKQSLFPLAHLMINNTSIDSNYVTFNITIFFMDLVDISNKLPCWYGWLVFDWCCSVKCLLSLSIGTDI